MHTRINKVIDQCCNLSVDTFFMNFGFGRDHQVARKGRHIRVGSKITENSSPIINGLPMEDLDKVTSELSFLI